jgi:hypothetical protein
MAVAPACSEAIESGVRFVHAGRVLTVVDGDGLAAALGRRDRSSAPTSSPATPASSWCSPAAECPRAQTPPGRVERCIRASQDGKPKPSKNVTGPRVSRHPQRDHVAPASVTVHQHDHQDRQRSVTAGVSMREA